MATKTIPFSVRLSEDDADFITNLKIENATTPSDKIRALIKMAKEKEKIRKDFKSCLRYLHEFFQPVIESVRAHEFQTRQQSKFIKRVLEWLPEFCTYVSAFNRKSSSDFCEFEKGVTDKIFELLKEIMNVQIYATHTWHDPAYLQQHLQEVLRLAQIMSNIKSQLQIEVKNGR